MTKLRLLCITAIIVPLTGCFGDGFGSCGDDNCDGSDIASTITIDDFVGVWDGRKDYVSEGSDENYMVVKPSGNITYYDYQGDSYNLGDNCYLSYAIKLTASGIQNSFNHPVTIDGQTKLDTIIAELSGTDLIFTSSNFSTINPGRSVYSPTTMLESDFIPICSDSNESL